MPPPRIFQQPPGSQLCGQACVAMVADVSLDRACTVIGHRKATGTIDIRRGLRALGVGCADRLRRVSVRKPIIPKRAILALTSRSGAAAHWLVSWDGELFDPEGYTLDDYPGWRVTSYLEIFG